LTFKIKAGIEKVSLAPVLDNNEITLVLAHGEQFILDNKPYSVKHYNDGSIYYEGNNSKLRSTVSDNSFCQLIVPFGKRSTLLLSDGTKVWLNSGSRLVYPPVFKGKNREVLLEGEAFFDVSKDQARPFYVRTDAFRIKVYGTRFDVQASGKENEFTATLVEGKVSIIPNEKFMPEEVFLLPNQKAISSKNHNNIEVKKLTDLENSFSWINGYFSFDKEEISGVLKKISHYYNVPIELDLGDNDLKITGKLDLKDDVERVISALTIFTKTKYMKQDNKYLIYNE
jgi:ferric-dicitrate binding protein FerR (iron transport regulator)